MKGTMNNALTPDQMNKAAGALWGLACGDAFGTTLEFSRPAGGEDFNRRLRGPHTKMIGGGAFRVEPGQVTDDTQMATAIAASLLKYDAFIPSDVAKRYARWRSSAFDIGGQTASAIYRFAEETNPTYAGVNNWLERRANGGRGPAGNGSLMRTAPIGVYFWNNPNALRTASILDSALTHGDPTCMIACAAFNAAIAVFVRSPGAPRGAGLLEAYKEAGLAAHEIMDRFPELTGSVKTALCEVVTDLGCAMDQDPNMGDMIWAKKGYVRTAFRLAFWELIHSRSYLDGIIDCVNRGGDADTNGAIAGALLGAFYGNDEIPTEWENLASFALSKTKPSSPLYTEFHPRVFDDLLDRMEAVWSDEDELPVVRTAPSVPEPQEPERMDEAPEAKEPQEDPSTVTGGEVATAPVPDSAQGKESPPDEEIPEPSAMEKLSGPIN